MKTKKKKFLRRWFEDIKTRIETIPGKIVYAKKIAGIMKNNEIVKVHVACGRNYKNGWVNIDNNRNVKTDILFDLTRGIPFPDRSVDFLYNEHFIEHLSYEEGFEFMKEALRVLKPDGVMRIAFPDLDSLIDSYVNDNWKEKEWVKLIDAYWYPSRCFMFNENIRENGGHKYYYSVEEMARRLVEAGFQKENIAVEGINSSKHEELANIDKRADSSVVEAVK